MQKSYQAMWFEAVEAFWESQKSCEWFQHHPILSSDDSGNMLGRWFLFIGCSVLLVVFFWKIRIVDESYYQELLLQYCIPLLFHGDDADSHRRRSFYTCTVSSILCEQDNSWDSRILLCTLDNSKALTETFDVIDAWLVHSFTELQEGRFMTVDPWGQNNGKQNADPICGPYRGILVGMKGDEKFIQRTLKVVTSWISEGVCMYCKAGQDGENQYTFHGPHAPHRGTLVSNIDFFRFGCRNNAWLRLPGFHLSRVLLDWLHLVDLSLTPECSASVLCPFITAGCFVSFSKNQGSLKIIIFNLAN